MDPTIVIDCGSHKLKHGIWRKPKKGTNTSLVFQDQPATYSSSDGWIDTVALIEQVHHIATEADVAANQFQILLAIPPLTPQRCKEYLAKACFEVLSVKRLCLGYTPVMSLIASGATSGITIDVGHEGTTVCPVVQAAPVPLFTTVLHGQGGGAVANALRSSLLSSHRDIAIDHETLHVGQRRASLVPPSSPKAVEEDEGEWSVTLPDGSTLSKPWSAQDLHSAAQCLIDGTSPVLATKLCVGEMVDAHPAFPTSYLLTGGASLTNGYSQYLAQGLSHNCLPSLKEPMTRLNCRDPVRQVWTGGTILAQLSSFQGLCVDRSLYEECGPRECLRYASTDIR